MPCSKHGGGRIMFRASSLPTKAVGIFEPLTQPQTNLYPKAKSKENSSVCEQKICPKIRWTSGQWTQTHYNRMAIRESIKVFQWSSQSPNLTWMQR